MTSRQGKITKPMTEQEKQIDAARKLLNPSPVELHAVPDWFRRAMLKRFGPFYDSTSGYAMLGHIQHDHRSGGFLDHFGKTIHRGKPAFVAEPYGVCLSGLQYIDWLCKEIGCKWTIEPNSWWFPGRTTRIVFYREDDAA
jgi:hypothetical protein